MCHIHRTTLLGLTLALLALVGRPPHAAADPIITVYPSVAPNKFGSPNWPGYVSNAVNLGLTGGVQNGGAPTGNSALPSFYSSTTTAKTSDFIVTDFPSWRGFANPGSVFGPAYANELGNRLTFGVHVNGNGQLFSLSQVGVDIEPSNPALVPFLSLTGNLGSIDYSNPGQANTVVGRRADGSLVLDPSTSTLLQEMWYVGAGVALEVDSTDPGATFQDKINNTLTDPLLQDPFSITGTYTLGGTSGSSTVNVTPSGPLAAPVPEPGSLLLLGAGLGVAGLLARRRRAARARS